MWMMLAGIFILGIGVALVVSLNVSWAISLNVSLVVSLAASSGGALRAVRNDRALLGKWSLEGLSSDAET
jgi:hypothetical protein